MKPLIRREGKALLPMAPRSGRVFWVVMLLLLIASGIIFWSVASDVGAVGDHSSSLDKDALSVDQREEGVPEVLYLLDYDPPHLLDSSADPNESTKAEEFRRIQAVLVKSRHLIERALSSAALKEVAFSGSPGPLKLVAWIEHRLKVDFLSPDLMRVTCPALPRAEAVQLLNAIADVYADDVVASDHRRRLEQYRVLENSYQELSNELRKKRSELNKLMERLEVGRDDDMRATELASLEAVQKDFRESQFEIFRKEAELRQLDASHLEKATLDESALNREIERDTTLAAMLARQMVLRILLSESPTDSATDSRPERARYEQELDALVKSERARRDALRQPLVDRWKTEAARERDAAHDKLRREIAVLRSTHESIEKELQRTRAELKTAFKRSIDVEMMQTELKPLEEVHRELALKLHRTEIELWPAMHSDNPRAGRIQLLSKAH